MCALGRRLSTREYEADPNEPPYTEAEIANAISWRQRVSPGRDSKRRDRCPHTPECGSITQCLEAIAWYFRYKPQLDADDIDVRMPTVPKPPLRKVK